LGELQALAAKYGLETAKEGRTKTINKTRNEIMEEIAAFLEAEAYG